MSYLPGQQYNQNPLGLWVPQQQDSIGNVQVSEPPTTLFYEDFASGAGVTSRWDQTGAGIATIAGGNMAFTIANTTQTTYVSKAIMPVRSSNYLMPAFAIKMEAAAATGLGRFWGLGTTPVGPSATSPAQEGVGFLQATNGTLQAVTITGGVITLIATLTRPTDAAIHRYSMMYRNSRCYWLLDGVEVASAPWLATAIQDMPMIISLVTGTVAGTAVFVAYACGCGDDNRLHTYIADPTTPTQRAAVSAAGALSVNLASSAGTVASVTQAVSAAAAATLTGTASTTASAVAAVDQSGNATFTLYGGTYTNLSLVFEASPDPTGLYWVPIDGARTDGGAIENNPIFKTAGVRAWNVIAPGYRWIRVRVAAITSTVAPSILITQGPFLYDPSPAVAPIDGQKVTYSATINQLAAAGFTSALGPQWELFNAGTLLMRITRVFLQITLATAGPIPICQLQKRNAASTGGTTSSVANNSFPHDSNGPASVATLKVWSATPTAGGGGLLVPRQIRGFAPATTMTTNPLQVEWLFGNRPGQALILRPGEALSFLPAAVAFATVPTVTGEIEWTEEPV